MKKIIWLLLPAMLLCAACRSGKSGTKGKKDPTTPTATVATSSPNPTPTTTPSSKQDKEDPDLSKMNIPVGSNFTSKVRVTITQNGKEITTNGSLRMRYDDVIQITLVDPLLGIAEVGRVELSPENVLIIDRMNKRYVSTSYDEFSALKSRNIDFRTIQAFFWQEARNGDKFAYTIPAKNDIKLHLTLSNKGNASNWNAHTQVSGKYTKTDANKLFSSMIPQ